MADEYDVIVVGVGGMGSAATYHLASRGFETLGLERYDVPHAMGSSHGVTRIIRKPQYEDPAYVPLVQAAYDGWRALEATTGRELLHVTGGIDAGPPNSRAVAGSRRSCDLHDIDYEVLTGAEVNERFPGYDLPAEHRAVYQPDGGFLVPEQCIIAHVEAAQAEGAEIHARERVADLATTGDGVRVRTPGATYEAAKLVVTAGAWAGKLLPDLKRSLTPERQVLGWFQPTDPGLFDPSQFPVFVHWTDDGHYYGVPRHDVPGFKLGRFNHLEEAVDPDEVDRAPRPDDEELLRSYARQQFPRGAGPTMRLETCLFTNTPDGHFVVDALPGRPEIVVGAGFSGHGFKFASVIGEILADLVSDGETAFEVDLFGADRFD